MSYRYSSLTGAIDDKTSPLRQYLDQRYPNLKPVQADYRAHAGTLIVAGRGASPGTLGAAFDYLLRFTCDGEYVPQPAVIAFLDRPDHVAVIGELSKLAGHACMRPLPENTVEVIARACWALALCTELYRKPFIFPNSPLAEPIRSGRFTTEVLLALVPDTAVAEMRSLYLLALAELADFLSATTSVAVLGPTFSASKLCAADADLIVDGVLIEVKTRLGAANPKTGQRSDSLPLTDIYQIIGYALFDTTDTFSVHTAALYSARYGALHTWPLQQLLDTLADAPIDLAAERAHVWKLLGGQQIPAIPALGGETLARQSLPITDPMSASSIGGPSRTARLIREGIGLLRRVQRR
ncbi:hypothetical protein KHQ06_19305 [Nocardia tengchongensis]|uniref:Restriction endonuclease n=1 Tax=Nocardia tengchongensis TaxID=2055889 RepID=A0ABX8CKK6_9NOCA|nr:hypothetical protein [Nocardia tengchongensis]QVI18700.1 hypothetical protein KHQ06_19305 [Nocardia tengchongensis]